MSKAQLLIYIAGPMKHDDMGDHLREACEAAYALERAGAVCYLPQLDYFRQLAVPKPLAFYIQKDRGWLQVADAMMRMPGTSVGADAEEKAFGEMGKPIFHELREAVLYAERKRAP